VFRPGTDLHVAALLAALLALACATGGHPLTDSDRIAGARALDTSFRVKDRVAIPGPHGSEYLLPIGEYRPSSVDGDGIYYAAPQGVLEHAGFAKRAVPGGIFVPSGPGSPWEHALLYVLREDGRPMKIAIPAVDLDRPDGALRFAVKGEEQGP
jgi:hypothetical protein